MKTGSLQRYGRTLAPEFDLAFQKSLGLGHFPIPMPALFLLEATAGINTAAAGPAARLNSRRFNGGLRRILGVSEQSGERPVTTEDRGRDAHCWTPPARIRTSPIRASGSYLGCLTAKRFAACRTRLSAWITRFRL